MQAANAIPLSHQKAWEGVAFTPTSGSPWIAIKHLPSVVGLRNHGILQIDINRPDGEGAKLLNEDIDAVLSHFSENKIFTGDHSFFVRRRDVSPIRPYAPWITASVSVHYRSAA